MAHSLKFTGRATRLRAPWLMASLALTFGACNSTDSTEPVATADPVDTPAAIAETAPPDLLNASLMRAGIPVGHFSQPTSTLGATYNGAARVIAPQVLLSELAAIKARGGRIILGFAGNHRHFKDKKGHFSLTMWKARMTQFKKVNFTQYINDGTIIGHYLLDEPNNAANWGGTTVSGATVEAAAQYSKQLWPGMATIVRAEPGYLAKWSGTYRYLDAAWAQYVSRKGEAGAYLKKNVADAKKKGLALVVGLNVSMGTANRRPMSPSQVASWGAKMLADPYPCAFISWYYQSGMQSTAMKNAQAALRRLAQNRGTKSCRS